MRNDTEHPFSLTIIESDMRLQVLRLNGREALNRPYRFDLDLIGLVPPISPDALLGQAAFLRLSEASGVHGIVHSVSLAADTAHLVDYRLTLVPYLQQLDQGPRRRVFHRLSVVQILQRLLEENAVPSHSYRFELPHGRYPSRPFCIQYEESDLTLLQRLCEEEGIHYHFEHDARGHVAVFAEDAISFPAPAVELLMRPDADRHSTLRQLYQRHRSITSGPPAGFRDRAPAEAAPPHMALATGAAGERIPEDPAQLHRFQAGGRSLERLRYRHGEIHGHSIEPALRSGHIAQICNHPLSAFNDQWLIVEVQHRGRQFSILETNLPATPPERNYRNRFSAIPWSTVFRPPLKHPRPRIPGYHVAYVLGPAGQPAWPDEHGQVEVCLWSPAEEAITLPVSWQAPDERSPLIAGSEVLVSFLEGDPDRPVLCPAMPGSGLNSDGTSPAHPSEPGGKDVGLLFDWLMNPPDASP
ncbi:type VI secretion system Vgr family protein [Pseudomonas sp. Z4-20]|uniref:type VI secretion system Vgr family protein n=1 Tax=Pseudomonas sp. Z4-20 TaxID=2817414 RepID=UPI003DA7D4E1